MGSKVQLSTVISFGLALLILCGCSENILDRTAEKDTTEAILFEANQALNKRDYDRALLLFNTLDPAVLADRDVALKVTSAYSGRCGLEFITMVEALGDASVSSIFGLLMAGFPLATQDKLLDCDEAEARLKAIGNETVRNIDENLLAAFNGFTEIGTLLASVADNNADGVVDPTFDQCDAGDISDAQVESVGAALAFILKSFAGIGEDFADVDEINDACADPNFAAICEKDNGGFSVNEIKVLRGFIGSSDVGIGSCGPIGDVSCLCL